MLGFLRASSCAAPPWVAPAHRPPPGQLPWEAPAGCHHRLPSSMNSPRRARPCAAPSTALIDR
eukprot:5043082-Pyramimonas_sp.AAC.1